MPNTIATKKDIAGLGPLNYETRRRMYLHPTLALTPERVPLGLLDLYRWARKPGSLGQGKNPSRTLEEKEMRPVLDAAPVLTEVTFDRPASNGRPARAVHQHIQAVRVTLKAPSRPARILPDVTVTALLATEIDPPAGEDPLDWVLVTNLPVQAPEQALEKLSWYLCRWQIEVYFKVLKSGCRVEQLQLQTRERLEPALAFYMIIA